MGQPLEGKSYREQHNQLADRSAAHKFADQCLWAEQTADKLLDLINSEPRTPTKEEIVALLLKTVTVT